MLQAKTYSRTQIVNDDAKRKEAENRCGEAIREKIRGYNPINMIRLDIMISGQKAANAAAAAGESPSIPIGRQVLKQTSFDEAYAMIRRAPSVTLSPPIPDGQGFTVNQVYMCTVDASGNEDIKWTILHDVTSVGPEVSVERFPDKIVDSGTLRVFRFKPVKPTMYAIVVDFKAAPPSSVSDRIVIRHMATSGEKVTPILISIAFATLCVVVVASLYAHGMWMRNKMCHPQVPQLPKAFSSL